jgi:DNA-binding CsgD family transcriptional regulator
VRGLEFVSTTTDPAFAADRGGRVLRWNAAAEEIFGVAAAEVVGRPCWEVLRGRDSFGNEYCSAHCPLREMILAGKAVNRCQLFLEDASGRAAGYSVVTMLLEGEDPPGPTLVHLLQPAQWDRRRQAAPRPSPEGNHDRGELTKRECEVLGLLAEGETTSGVASTLRISEATARNHIQRVLHKLHVHSRLAAVAVARRAGLV